MATGITGQEQLGKNALVASQSTGETVPPLPYGETVSLEYKGKLPEPEILRPRNPGFVRFVVEEEAERKANKLIRNSFVLGDNFLVMHKLLHQNEKFDLIYLDPPYGTGMAFQTRTHMHAYEDKYDTSSYLEFMRRRLILMRELLSEDGSIYIHIGHQMLCHLKILMDEIFGVRNFRNIISRRKCSSKNFTKNQYGNLNDYILFYTKSNNYIWNQPGVKPDEEWIEKEYPKVDRKGRFKLVPIHAPGTRRGETGGSWRGMNPPPGKHWQFVPGKLDEFDKNGEIHWSKNGNPRRKVYLPKGKMRPMTDYWHDFRDAHHQSIKITGYPTEKNLSMLKLIVGASSEVDGYVLDPFCGSGAVLQAAADLERNWMGIDESLTAISAMHKRFEMGVSRMGDYVKKGDTSTQLEMFRKSYDYNFYVDHRVFQSSKDDIISALA